MRTTSRLAASAAVLGGALLFAAPATAQTAPTPCAYPFINCPTTPAPSPSASPGGGGGTVETPAPSSTPLRGGGGGTAVSNRSNLPFTGGEITLLALAGTAALGGGAALVVAGRRRQSA